MALSCPSLQGLLFLQEEAELVEYLSYVRKLNSFCFSHTNFILRNILKILKVIFTKANNIKKVKVKIKYL